MNESQAFSIVSGMGSSQFSRAKSGVKEIIASSDFENSYNSVAQKYKINKENIRALMQITCPGGIKTTHNLAWKYKLDMKITKQLINSYYSKLTKASIMNRSYITIHQYLYNYRVSEEKKASDQAMKEYELEHKRQMNQSKNNSNKKNPSSSSKIMNNRKKVIDNFDYSFSNNNKTNPITKQFSTYLIIIAALFLFLAGTGRPEQAALLITIITCILALFHGFKNPKIPVLLLVTYTVVAMVIFSAYYRLGVLLLLCIYFKQIKNFLLHLLNSRVR